MNITRNEQHVSLTFSGMEWSLFTSCKTAFDSRNVQHNATHDPDTSGWVITLHQDHASEAYQALCAVERDAQVLRSNFGLGLADVGVRL